MLGNLIRVSLKREIIFFKNWVRADGGGGGEDDWCFCGDWVMVMGWGEGGGQGGVNVWIYKKNNKLAKS